MIKLRLTHLVPWSQRATTPLAQQLMAPVLIITIIALVQHAAQYHPFCSAQTQTTSVLPAGTVTHDSATISGLVNPSGGAPVTVGFEYTNDVNGFSYAVSNLAGPSSVAAGIADGIGSQGRFASPAMIAATTNGDLFVTDR